MLKTELNTLMSKHKVRFVMMDVNEDRTYYKAMLQQDTLYILVPEMQDYSGFTSVREKSALNTDFKTLQRHIQWLQPNTHFLTQSL